MLGALQFGMNPAPNHRSVPGTQTDLQHEQISPPDLKAPTSAFQTLVPQQTVRRALIGRAEVTWGAPPPPNPHRMLEKYMTPVGGGGGGG